MSLLDRYIARQYFFNVVALLVILFSFVVMVDVALHMDRFITVAKDRAADAGVPAPEGPRLIMAAFGLVLDLWWPRLLQLFNLLLGLVLVAAMGFTITQFVRHRELLAMLASGISLHRVARPILIVAVVMTVVQGLNQELVISQPKVTPLLTRDHGDAGKHYWSGIDIPLTADGLGRMFHADRLDPGEGGGAAGSGGVMTGVSVWLRDETGRVYARISADEAHWRAGGWDLVNPTSESLLLVRPGAPAGVETPTRIETNLDPRALLVRRYASLGQSLSLAQISGMLADRGLDLKTRSRLERVRWGRVSAMLANLLTIMITLPFFAVREPRNMVIQSLKCAPIGIIALMGSVLGTQAAIPGLPPQLAVFIPVMMLIPIAIVSGTNLKT